MSRIFECPKCGADISDSYQSDEPDVGIVGGWYCNACDRGYYKEDPPDFGPSWPDQKPDFG